MPGPDEFGPDGTQAPPPTRLYPDPLAGLLTGETYTAPEPVVPRVVPPVFEPDPEIARAAIRAAAAEEQRLRQLRARPPRQRQGQRHRPPAQQHRPPVQQQRPPVQQYRPPVQHQGVLPPQSQPFTPPNGAEEPRRSGSSFGGCLVALVIFGALALTVFRQVLDALVDVFR